jgi:DNA repair exonuclease SbcCD ATPase subunit
MDGVRKLKETDILKAKKKLARQAKASYEQYMKGIEERIKGIEERNQTIRVEEEKHQQAKKVEDERRSRVQTLRKSSGQCVICGQKLGLFPKLLGSDRHSKCKVFRD